MTTISAPDTSCRHCKASIEASRGALAGVAAVTVNSPQHLVEVSGTAKPTDILANLAQTGFPAAPISAG